VLPRQPQFDQGILLGHLGEGIEKHVDAFAGLEGSHEEEVIDVGSQAVGAQLLCVADGVEREAAEVHAEGGDDHGRVALE